MILSKNKQTNVKFLVNAFEKLRTIKKISAEDFHNSLNLSIPMYRRLTEFNSPERRLINRYIEALYHAGASINLAIEIPDKTDLSSVIAYAGNSEVFKPWIVSRSRNWFTAIGVTITNLMEKHKESRTYFNSLLYVQQNKSSLDVIFRRLAEIGAHVHIDISYNGEALLESTIDYDNWYLHATNVEPTNPNLPDHRKVKLCELLNYIYKSKGANPTRYAREIGINPGQFIKYMNKDKVTSVTINSYIRTLLLAGFDIEFFVKNNGVSIKDSVFKVKVVGYELLDWIAKVSRTVIELRDEDISIQSTNYGVSVDNVHKSLNVSDSKQPAGLELILEVFTSMGVRLMMKISSKELKEDIILSLSKVETIEDELNWSRLDLDISFPPEEKVEDPLTYKEDKNSYLNKLDDSVISEMMRGKLKNAEGQIMRPFL